MKRSDVIAALQGECRTDWARIEDFLSALGDLLSETLQKGERFNLDFGSFELRPIIRDDKAEPLAAVRFRPSAKLRKHLKLAEFKWDLGSLCTTCGKRPKKKEPYCSSCKDKRFGKGKHNRDDGTGFAAAERRIL